MSLCVRVDTWNTYFGFTRSYSNKACFLNGERLLKAAATSAAKVGITFDGYKSQNDLTHTVI